MTFNVYATEFSTQWDENYNKKLVISCLSNDFMCREFCGEATKCEFPEKVCRDCIGSSPYITNIFQEMGRTYRNLGYEVNYSQVMDLILKGHFATFTSKSIYNQLGRFDSANLKQKFKSLCPDEDTEYPVVFFKTDVRNRKLGKVQFVTCSSGIYVMSDYADVDIDGEDEPSLDLY